MADGYLGKCKECQKENTKAARERNPEIYREYDKRRANLPHRVIARAEYQQTQQFKESQKRSRVRWVEKHPNRRAANIILGNAVRDGKIKPLPCVICGRKAQAHHPDYDQPMDVVWLCYKHHREAHVLHKELTSEKFL